MAATAYLSLKMSGHNARAYSAYSEAFKRGSGSVVQEELTRLFLAALLERFTNTRVGLAVGR